MPRRPLGRFKGECREGKSESPLCLITGPGRAYGTSGERRSPPGTERHSESCASRLASGATTTGSTALRPHSTGKSRCEVKPHTSLPRRLVLVKTDKDLSVLKRRSAPRREKRTPLSFEHGRCHDDVGCGGIPPHLGVGATDPVTPPVTSR